MNKNKLSGIIVFFTVLTIVSILSAAETGFVALFNGKDLSGWFMGPDKSWVVEEGVITLKREFDGKEHNSDYLWNKEIYGDFIVELEFKVPEQANSGIYLRAADVNNPVYTGIEVQVNNSFGKTNLSRTATAGALYDCLAPTRNAVKKPGEWNKYRITCRQNKISVMLNGELVNEMDLNKWPKARQNPDGSKNKFPVALKDFARKGHFGLQDHGRPVWYRNIKIKKLN
jgi:hypothetical protein